MGSALAILAGGGLFLLGAIFGRYLPGRRKGPNQPQPKLRGRDFASTTAASLTKGPAGNGRHIYAPPYPTQITGAGFTATVRRDVTDDC
jgi:hypothetical protein